MCVDDYVWISSQRSTGWGGVLKCHSQPPAPGFTSLWKDPGVTSEGPRQGALLLSSPTFQFRDFTKASVDVTSLLSDQVTPKLAEIIGGGIIPLGHLSCKWHVKCAITMDDHLEQYPLTAAWVNMHIHTHIHTHICIHICKHTYTHIHTYIHICIHTNIHICTIYTHIHICIYRTIALISHTSKVMLKIFQAKLQQYVTQEFPDV